LFEAGATTGITAIGTIALDMVRIEAGFVQAGVDFLPADEAVRPGRSRSPLELGLGWLVDFKKPHFNGRQALLAEQARGSRYNFVKLVVDGKQPSKDAVHLQRARQGRRHRDVRACGRPRRRRTSRSPSLDAPWGRPDDELYARSTISAS
jgi:aminomethyltransferase